MCICWCVTEINNKMHCATIKIGPIVCPERSVANSQLTLSNILWKEVLICTAEAACNVA